MPFAFSAYITPKGGGGATSVINPGAVATSPLVIQSPDAGDTTTISVANSSGETVFSIADNVSAGAGFSFRAGNGATTLFEFRSNTTTYVTINNSEPKLRLSSSSVANAGWTDASIRRVAASVLAADGTPSAAGWIQNTAGEHRINGDGTNTTTTPATMGMTATLIAGRAYAGELIGFFSEATAADGLRLDFGGGTATMTSFRAQGFLSDDNGFQALAQVTDIATDITATTITGNTLVRMSFGFVCNAAGTFIPRYAKEADAAGAALTIQGNTHMTIRDVPA